MYKLSFEPILGKTQLYIIDKSYWCYVGTIKYLRDMAIAENILYYIGHMLARCTHLVFRHFLSNILVLCWDNEVFKVYGSCWKYNFLYWKHVGTMTKADIPPFFIKWSQNNTLPIFVCYPGMEEQLKNN